MSGPARLFAPVVMLGAWLLPWGIALAQDGGGPVSGPAPTWSDLTTASPPVAIAFALAYGMFKAESIVTSLANSWDKTLAVLEKGIPVRIKLELAEKELAIAEHAAGGVRAPRPRQVG